MDLTKLDVTKKISIVQNECARTRILWLLDCVYPKWQNSLVLHRALERHWAGISYVQMIAELHYLNEKGLLHIHGPRRSLWRAQITAKGKDFLEGNVSEPGLAPADLF